MVWCSLGHWETFVLLLIDVCIFQVCSKFLICRSFLMHINIGIFVPLCVILIVTLCVWLPAWLSLSLSLCPSVLSFFLSVSLYRSLWLSLCLCLCLFFCICVCVCVCLSHSLSLSLSRTRRCKSDSSLSGVIACGCSRSCWAVSNHDFVEAYACQSLVVQYPLNWCVLCIILWGQVPHSWPPVFHVASLPSG